MRCTEGHNRQRAPHHVQRPSKQLTAQAAEAPTALPASTANLMTSSANQGQNVSLKAALSKAGATGKRNLKHG